MSKEESLALTIDSSTEAEFSSFQDDHEQSNRTSLSSFGSLSYMLSNTDSSYSKEIEKTSFLSSKTWEIRIEEDSKTGKSRTSLSPTRTNPQKCSSSLFSGTSVSIASEEAIPKGKRLCLPNHEHCSVSSPKRTPLANVTNKESSEPDIQKYIHSRKDYISAIPKKPIPLQLDEEKLQYSNYKRTPETQISTSSGNDSSILQSRSTEEPESTFNITIGDKELISFCGIVLRLLKRELEQTPGGKPYSKPLSTLPQLRKAFYDLVACANVPRVLEKNALEMKQELEGKRVDINIKKRNKEELEIMSQEDMMSEWCRRLSLNKREMARQKDIEMKSELEKLSQQFQEEIASVEEKAAKQAEVEWKRKLSLSKREAKKEADKQAAIEKAGLVNFAKQCVKAISVLKKKVEEEQNRKIDFEDEKQKAINSAMAKARDEAEQIWARRLSMARHEIRQQTKESLVNELRLKYEEELKKLTAKVRAETEADWSVRLMEEQKNRRLSCQLKLTAAVERTSKKCAQEKEMALAALAEELEKEKEEAIKNATENATHAVEREWQKKYEADLENMRSKMNTMQRKQPHSKVESSIESNLGDLMKNDTAQQESRIVVVDGRKPGINEQYSRNHRKVRHPSWAESAKHNKSYRHSHGPATSKAPLHDFSMISEKPKRVSFFIGRDIDRSIRDFSTEFALPSPIPIVSMPLDETNPAITPMVAVSARMNAQGLHSRTQNAETRINNSAKPIFFHVDELAVRIGEVRSSFASKYREYHVNSLVTVSNKGQEKQYSACRTLRYSTARQIFHDDLSTKAKALGVLPHFDTLLCSFPPKLVAGSCSSKVSEARANALRNYILSACDICSRLIASSSAEEERAKLREILFLFFGEFMPK